MRPAMIDKMKTFRKGRTRIALCTDQLSEWFDIDPERPLYVAFHNRPSGNRLKVTRTPWEGNEEDFEGWQNWETCNYIAYDRYNRPWELVLYDGLQRWLWRLPDTFHVEMLQ